MSDYQYDFQTCGHAIIDEVRAIVESQREWDFSSSVRQARTNSLVAERRYGIKRPRSAEQRALTKYLIESHAGLHIATYAWGTYVDLKASTIVGDMATS